MRELREEVALPKKPLSICTPGRWCSSNDDNDIEGHEDEYDFSDQEAIDFKKNESTSAPPHKLNQLVHFYNMVWLNTQPTTPIGPTPTVSLIFTFQAKIVIVFILHITTTIDLRNLHSLLTTVNL